jgi:hypothetical protein
MIVRNKLGDGLVRDRVLLYNGFEFEDRLLKISVKINSRLQLSLSGKKLILKLLYLLILLFYDLNIEK